MEGNIAHGVNLMQIGPAEGHFVTVPGKDGKGKKIQEYVDATTLQQALACCNKAGANGVKIKNTHNGDATDIMGRAFSFSISGDSLRASADFNPDHGAFKSVAWSLKNIPDNLGFSIGFKPSYEIDGDKALVRIEEVYHFALEDETATTPGGVYSIPRQNPKTPKQVDTNEEDNMDEATTKQINDAVSATVAAAMLPFTTQYARDMAEIKASIAPVATYKKELDDAMEGFSKKLPDFIKTASDAAIVGFAKTKLGLDIQLAPNAAPVVTKVDASGGNEFIALVREGMSAKKFSKVTDAIVSLAQEKPEAYKAYSAAGFPSITL